MTGLVGCRRGASAVEFALVMPAFLMGTFLLLEGGRAEYKKQALNELSAAAARCAAIAPTGCKSVSDVQSWTVSRASSVEKLTLTTAMVTVTMVGATAQAGVCNGVASMAQVTIAYPYTQEKMTLLPQSTMPAKLTATSCFPVVT